MKENRNKVAGFTLAELLIVSMLLGVVSLAIYSTLNNGVSIWQKLSQSAPEEDVEIFLSKFSLELRNCFRFTGINFQGTEDKLEFASLINSAALARRIVGRVMYSYDPGRDALLKEVSDMSQVYSSTNSQEPAVAINNIKSFHFQYYAYNLEKKDYIWLDDWAGKELPLAVRMELEFNDGKGLRKYVKSVSIPSRH